MGHTLTTFSPLHVGSHIRKRNRNDGGQQSWAHHAGRRVMAAVPKTMNSETVTTAASTHTSSIADVGLARVLCFSSRQWTRLAAMISLVFILMLYAREAGQGESAEVVDRRSVDL